MENTDLSSSTFDLNKAYSIIKSYKKNIVLFVLLSFLSASFYVFFVTPLYTSKITLYPTKDLIGNNSLLGNLKNYAESFGVPALTQTPTYNLEDVLRSKRLKKDIINKKWYDSEALDSTDLISYWRINDPSVFNLKKMLSLFKPMGKYSIDKQSIHIQLAIEMLDDRIIIKDNLSGLIEVSVIMENPFMSSDIANFISKRVQTFIDKEQKKQAVENRVFIEQQLIDSKKELSNSEQQLTSFRKQYPIALDTPDLQQSRARFIRDIEVNQQVYITLRQQYELAKIEELKNRLLIILLDEADPPIEKSFPQRLKILILTLIISLVLSSFYVIIRFY